MKGPLRLLAAVLFFCLTLPALTQTTTSGINGTVKDEKGVGLVGASIEAVHEPSGTRYRTITLTDGRFSIPGMRIGGPYTVRVSFVGFKQETYNDIYLQLGTPGTLDALLTSDSKALQEVVITTGRRSSLFGADKKGTGTNISRRTLENMPTLNRSLPDMVRLVPQVRLTTSGISIAGQDDRYNNLTIDGSIFNNSFGLQGLPGSQTNSTPISLDAIEEVQVNVTSVNLKDAGFTGGSINAVTRSGTNTFHGSVFYNQRNEDFVGKKANGTTVPVSSFDVKQFGFRLGGPIIKNKLFFFINAEGERRTDPGTGFVANEGQTGSNVTRVSKTDLDDLSAYLRDSLSYDPGAYQDYPLRTFSNKALAKIDWNINDQSKFSIRFNYLRSYRDVPVSNSGSFNNRRDNLFAMTYANSNYTINNDIYSVIAELNTNVSNRFSNNLILGFTANRDYRSSGSSVFPLVDILNGGRNYITFGYEPFTPNNTLNTNTYQFSDNLRFNVKKHTLSVGVNFEHFSFLNIFTPTLYGQYVFNSLNDFYSSARAFINDPNMAANPLQLRRYNLTYSALPGGELWNATLKAYSAGAYIQDDFSPDENITLTYGVRFDVPFLSQTGYANDSVSSYKFENEYGSNYSISTNHLPGAKVLISPRFGFNWDVRGDRTTQVRGSLGLYAGRPAFVWIANQLSNNGVQSGSISSDNTTAYPFSTDVKRNIPATVTVPAPSYNVAATDPNYKYPQLFRANLGIERRVTQRIVVSVEGLLSSDINNVGYINANLTDAISDLPGPDKRPIYGSYDLGRVIPTAPADRRSFKTSSGAINSALRRNVKITDATVLKNMGDGFMYGLTVKIERNYYQGFSWGLAYNYGVAKDFITAGSIAFSSWRDNLSYRGNNFPDLSYSNNDQRHRIIGNISYRKEFLKAMAVQVSLFGEARNLGRYHYIYSGDMNGDGITTNDLMYIPKNTGEMNFVSWTDARNTADPSDDVTYTAAQQKDAFEKYISQDKYLSSHRGEFVNRNGALLPWIERFDFSVVVEVFKSFGGKRHTIQIRGDIFNVGNMINNKWGVSKTLNNNAFLDVTNIPIDPNGNISLNTPTTNTNISRNPIYDNNGILYRFVPNTRGSIDYGSFTTGTSISDVWQAQIGLRYIF